MDVKEVEKAGGFIQMGVTMLCFQRFVPDLHSTGVLLIAGGLACGAMQLIGYRNEKLWQRIGINTSENAVPLPIKKRRTAFGKEIVYTIPTGFCFEDFEGKKEQIETAFKKRIKLEKADNYKLILTIFDEELKDLYKFSQDLLCNDQMKFTAGYSQNSAKMVECIDLNSSDCHMLITGTTGSGKSEFLRHILTQFIMQCKGKISKGKLYISDLKGGVTTKIFSKASNCVRYTVFPNETVIMMKELHEIMMKRYIKLNSTNCVDYKEYNKKFKSQQMEPIVFVIEEYSLLFSNKEATELMFLLLNLSRAANISVILTIQRPDFKTLDTRIKANLRTTVCFKCKYDVDSEIVLGHGNYLASRELKKAPPGRGILNDECHDDVVFQSVYMTTKEIEEYLKEYLTKPAILSSYEDEIEDVEEEKPVKSMDNDIKALESLI